MRCSRWCNEGVAGAFRRWKVIPEVSAKLSASLPVALDALTPHGTKAVSLSRRFVHPALARNRFLFTFARTRHTASFVASNPRLGGTLRHCVTQRLLTPPIRPKVLSICIKSLIPAKSLPCTRIRQYRVIRGTVLGTRIRGHTTLICTLPLPD